MFFFFFYFHFTLSMPQQASRPSLAVSETISNLYHLYVLVCNF